MKDLGKTRILGTISMKIDWVANMVVLEYISEILNEVQYGNDEKGSCHMEEVEARFKCFDAWWAKPHEWIGQSCMPWYVHIQICPML